MDAARRGRLLLLAGAVTGLALALLGTLAPTRTTPRSPGPGEVARVNAVPVAHAELERALARVEADTGNAPTALERRRVLERLIDEELLVQRGVALGLVESDATVRKALASAVIAAVVADAASTAPTPAELQAFFAANHGYFTTPTRVRVARIFVRDGDGSDARVEAALAALAGGAAPEQVVREFGDSTPLVLPDALLPESKLRELLGPTEAGIALALEPRAHSAALASGDGRSILVSLERESGAPPQFASVRQQVESEWVRRAAERALAAYLAMLRAEAEIRLADDAPP